jgi:RND family efflux transporter MFP subunit
VKAQVGGRLGTIGVDRGSRVSAGQVLVEIEAEGVKGQAASARALVASAEAALALATQRLESARRLQAAGAISDIDLRATEAAHEAAAAQVAATKAQLAAAGEAESRTVVTAPLAGVVSARAVESGEAVKDGDRLFTIVDIAALELDAQVGVDAAMRVRVGSPVTFALDALPGQLLQGRVVRIDPRADPGTRQVGVAAQLANPGGRIVAGQYARGRILTGQSVTAGQARVYVIDGTTLSLRHITLGTQDDAQGLVAVLEGLSANDRILARPVVGAANGLPVTIASDSARSQATPDGSK